MNARRTLPALLLALFLGASPLLAGAQVGTPATAQRPPLDLAAMALAPGDVPVTFFDDYGEWWVPAAQVPDALGGAAVPPGLQWMYQSFSCTQDETACITSYLFAFASPQEATSGIGIVDPALRPPLPEGTTAGPVDLLGPDLGDEPRVMTVVTYDTRAAGGPLVDVVAASFRRDRLIAGVSVEQYSGASLAGTPVGPAATPVIPDPAQEQLANDLAATLDARITTVLSGGAPAGVDPALAALVLPLAALASAPVPILGGYKSGIDLLRCGICGEENSLVPFADTALGGFNRTVALGPLVEGEPQPPFVSVAVSAFTSPEAAREVLEAVRKAPNDLPTAGPVPRGERTLAEEPAIPGATAALAYLATLNGDDPAAPPDSAGIAFVIGTRMVTVDVQGGLSAEAAMAAAVDLATQQAACLDAGSCTSVTMPPALAAPATPAG